LKIIFLKFFIILEDIQSLNKILKATVMSSDIYLRKMITNVPKILVKKLNKVWMYWNLCNLLFISIKKVLFNIKVTSLGIMIHCCFIFLQFPKLAYKAIIIYYFCWKYYFLSPVKKMHSLTKSVKAPYCRILSQQ
jgi:hypothetical protein